jgi:hypothetical protein
MSEYHPPYYDRLRYYRTMLEMAADWWGVEADREIEEQGGEPTKFTEPLLASSNLAHELKMLDESISDYEHLPPCPDCEAELAWGPLVEFDPREMLDEGPLGTRTCEQCGHREEFGEEYGYGEKPEDEWELERFPEVAYLWLKRFGPEPKFFDEEPETEGPAASTE